ncbi:hypothetical protein LB506_008241 [Fusarium annulatum]|nr:hypothetical protein LB506_008241 [Fusarium annulatum]
MLVHTNYGCVLISFHGFEKLLPLYTTDQFQVVACTSVQPYCQAAHVVSAVAPTSTLFPRLVQLAVISAWRQGAVSCATQL